MPQKRSTVKRDQRRAQALAAALRRFARDGYAETTTRDISSDLGLGTAGVYFYFSSKEEILFEILRTEITQLRDALDELLSKSSHMPVLDRLRAAVSYNMRHALEHQDVWSVTNSYRRALTEAHAQEVVDLLESYNERFRRLVEEGNDSGVWHMPYPKFWVFNLWAVSSRASTWFRPVGPCSLEEVVAFNTDFVMASLVPLG